MICWCCSLWYLKYQTCVSGALAWMRQITWKHLNCSLCISARHPQGLLCVQNTWVLRCCCGGAYQPAVVHVGRSMVRAPVFSSFQRKQVKVSAPSSLRPLCSGMPWPSSRRVSSARCFEPWIKMYVYQMSFSALLVCSWLTWVGFFSYGVIEKFVVTSYLHEKPHVCWVALMKSSDPSLDETKLILAYLGMSLFWTLCHEKWQESTQVACFDMCLARGGLLKWSFPMFIVFNYPLVRLCFELWEKLMLRE